VLEAMFAVDVAIEEVESKDGTITVFALPPSSTKPKRLCSRHFQALSWKSRKSLSFRSNKDAQWGDLALV